MGGQRDFDYGLEWSKGGLVLKEEEVQNGKREGQFDKTW